MIVDIICIIIAVILTILFIYLDSKDRGLMPWHIDDDDYKKDDYKDD